MKLRILENSLKKPDTVLIGKSGILRISNSFALNMNFSKDETWQVAIDTDEVDLKHLYFFKAKANDKNNAWKLLNINNRWVIDIANVAKEYKIALPQKCLIEKYSVDKNEGFRISLV